MTISNQTRKSLWARSGNRCVFCRIELVEGKPAGKPQLVLGQEAHIVGKRPGAARYEPLPAEVRDGHDNLILLCANDHIRIDRDEVEYPVGLLHLLKRAHEEWVRLSLEINDETRTDWQVQAQLMTTGKDLWEVLAGVQMYDFVGIGQQTPEMEDQSADWFEELKWVGELSTELQDQGFPQILAQQRDLDRRIAEISAAGLHTFGARRKFR